MDPFKVLTTLLFYIQNSRQVSLLEPSPYGVTNFPGVFIPINTKPFSTPAASIPPLFNLSYLLPVSANEALSHHPRLRTFYSPSAYFVSPPSKPVIPNRWYAKVYQVVRELIIFLKVNFLYSVCNILFQLVQHSLTLSLLQVIISAFRVYCRARYLINCAKPDIWYCGSLSVNCVICYLQS